MKKSLIFALTSIGAACVIYSCIKDRDNIARSEKPYSDMANSQGNVELEAKIVSEMYYGYIYRSNDETCKESTMRSIANSNDAVYNGKKIHEWILSSLQGGSFDAEGLDFFSDRFVHQPGGLLLPLRSDYRYPILDTIIHDTDAMDCVPKR